jgi:hypothetical protein
MNKLIVLPGGDLRESAKFARLRNAALGLDVDDCPECDGEGFIDGDCFEDTCCCADPIASHGIKPCPFCGGRR